MNIIIRWAEINGYKIKEVSFVAIACLAIVAVFLTVVGQGGTNASDMAVAAFGTVYFPCLIALYFAPSIAAALHKHPQQAAITILNLLLGWSGIGWVVAFVWAYVTPNPDKAAPSEPRRHPASAKMRTCPFCAEDVRAEAIKCRHCQSDLTATVAPAPA